MVLPIKVSLYKRHKYFWASLLLVPAAQSWSGWRGVRSVSPPQSMASTQLSHTFSVTEKLNHEENPNLSLKMFFLFRKLFLNFWLSNFSTYGSWKPHTEVRVSSKEKKRSLKNDLNLYWWLHVCVTTSAWSAGEVPMEIPTCGSALLQPLCLPTAVSGTREQTC